MLHLFKRIAALGLVILICTPLVVHSAVVSDNDGSAFITKAEFDSLKNSFQSQIDTYNQSIDSKIDEAISSYLAGIKISTTTLLNGAKSKLEYPISIYMKNVNLKWSDWSVNGATPYWEPKLSVYLWGQRYSMCFAESTTYNASYKNNWFYDGSWDTSISKYVATGTLSDVEGIYSLYGSFYSLTDREGKGTGRKNQISFALDQTAKHAREGQSYNTWITRTNIRASLNSTIPFRASQTSTYLTVEAMWNWQANNAFSTKITFGSSSTTDPEKYLNQWKAGASNTYPYYETAGLGYYSTYSLDYKSKGINRVFNNNVTYDSTNDTTKNKHVEVPVAYTETDGLTIYLTNKNNFKRNIQTAEATFTNQTNGYYNRDGDPYDTTWYFDGLITPGWTLEPQFSGSAKNKYNRSLMEPKDVVYKVTLPYTSTVENHTLSNGFLLTEISTSNTNADGKIDLNITSENSAVTKYIVVSTSPISEGDITNITDTSTGYIGVKNSSSVTSYSKKCTLSEGDNTIYFDKVNKGEKLYIKILWDKDNATYVKLNSQPKVTLNNEA